MNAAPGRAAATNRSRALAGLGVGFYDRKALASAQQSGSRIAPGARREDLVAVRAGWKRAVAAAQAFGSGS